MQCLKFGNRSWQFHWNGSIDSIHHIIFALIMYPSACSSVQTSEKHAASQLSIDAREFAGSASVVRQPGASQRNERENKQSLSTLRRYNLFLFETN